MLTHLSIKHLTLVDRLELEIGPGMTVVTGETGAGKSILLGALGLALGDRADSSLISPAASKAEINASFDLEGHDEAIQWLEEKSLSDDGQCILRRTISRDGRSRAFINGSATTLNELRALSEMLLDIHSQHEHQSLLKKETHRRLLDGFGGLKDVVQEVGARFESMSALQEQLTRMKADAEEQTARVQLLSYQAEELTNLSLTQGETTALEEEQKRLASAEQTIESLDLVQRLCGDDDESASVLIARGRARLEGIDDDVLTPIREMLANAQIQLDEAMSDLAAMQDRFEANPERLRELETRLGTVYEIARKHKVEPDELPGLTTQITSELDSIINADSRIAELEAELSTATEQYNDLAEKLNASRQQTANLLTSEITAQLQDLGMDGALFTVTISPLEAPSRHGLDDIEFRITTIPGSKPGALSKVASGGELSRISLAIQVVTAKTACTPTLVFDEVDVGVGGATAEVVGKLLRKLGADAQILCVTHLPQVAAQSHHHFRVAKSMTEDQAVTTVTALSEEEKVNEIARMLGGIEKTDQSMAHAEQMISSSKG